MNNMAWEQIECILDDVLIDATKTEAPSVHLERLREGYQAVYELRQTDNRWVYEILQEKLRGFLCSVETTAFIDNYDTYCRIIQFIRLFFYFFVDSLDVESLFYLFYSDYLSPHRNKCYGAAICLRQTDRSGCRRYIGMMQYFDREFRVDMYPSFVNLYLDDIQREFREKYHAMVKVPIGDYLESAMTYLAECHNRESDLSIGWDYQETMFLSIFLTPHTEELSLLFHEWLIADDHRLKLCHDALCMHPPDVLKAAYRSHLRTISTLPMDATLISKLSVIHSQEQDHIRRMCQNGSLMRSILCEHWRAVFQTKALCWYIRHIDRQIRKRDEELTVDLIPFIDNKDIFIRDYYTLMAQRMVENPTMYLEEKMLETIREHMGNSQVCPIETLLRETKQSLELHREYGTNIHVFVWSRCYVSDIPIQYKTPEFIESSHERYASFYRARYGNLRLKLLFGAGRVWLRATYELKRTYELEMDEVQAHILLCLERYHTLSEDELVRHVMDGGDADLSSHLDSLAGLVHCRDNKEWAINPHFHSKRRCISLPRPKRRSVTNTSTQSILTNRQFVVDSAIVRIMKTRRILSHSDLIVETSQSIQQFVADVRFIKERIENLIEKEYLERNADDHRVYHYVL